MCEPPWQIWQRLEDVSSVDDASGVKRDCDVGRLVNCSLAKRVGIIILDWFDEHLSLTNVNRSVLVPPVHGGRFRLHPA